MEAIGLHKKGEVSLEQILHNLSKLPNYHEAGAIASFIGVVREEPIRGSEAKVVRLEYEAYTEVALKRMREIRDEMKKRNGVIEVSIHHVIDAVDVGEPSLFVAVLGKHRQDVFPVISETVDRVKKDVPIWKKELTTKDSYWVASNPDREHVNHSR